MQIQSFKNYLRVYIIDGANCHDEDDGGQEGASCGENDEANGNDSAGCNENAPTDVGNDDDGEDGSHTPVNIEEGKEGEGGHITGNKQHGGQDDSILSAKLIRIAPKTSSF